MTIWLPIRLSKLWHSTQYRGVCLYCIISSLPPACIIIFSFPTSHFRFYLLSPSFYLHFHLRFLVSVGLEWVIDCEAFLYWVFNNVWDAGRSWDCNIFFKVSQILLIPSKMLPRGVLGSMSAGQHDETVQQAQPLQPLQHTDTTS